MAAEAALSFAVETLGNLLIQKAIFLKGVEGDVKWLRNELKRMQCFLKDAANKQSESESIRNWILEIREVAHDAEDAIEIFVLDVESKGLKERCACFPNHMHHLNKVGEEIQSIRQRLKDIEESRVRYKIEDLGDHERVESRAQLEVESRRRLAYWQNDKHVVGLEKYVELLLRKAILEKSEGLSVAAILGMGGIGKSTLASIIYSHPAVVDRFECRAWVVVSRDFTFEDITKQIMLQMNISLDHKVLESIKDNLSRQEYLKKELHEGLAGKRYFIVLDDVWEAVHWESLSSAFPHEDKAASRLLLTSRNQVMNEHNGYVHKMKIMKENESRELFLRKAVVDNTNGKFPEKLKNIGEEILRKCGGLPLAISVVGSLLAKKTRSMSDWEKLLNEMKSHIDKRRGDVDIISSILELSYQNLSPELKACFVCLGFFKEDAIIKVKNLLHIWVAQGLVPLEVVRVGETKEDVAKEYLNELVSRNMVQVKEMEYDRVKGCHMHDLLRELSIRKATEEIDFEEVREEGSSHQSFTKPRHRAMYFSRLSFVYSTNRDRYLRSLFINGGETQYTKKSPPSYWKSFKLLRVLDLGNAIWQVLPKEIGVLTGLRYFKMIYAGGISKLPQSWGKLKNLEILDLRCYSMIIMIDKVVLKMESLRHLYSYISHSEVPLGNMSKLETLSLFKVKDSDLWQIQGLGRLSKLGIDMSAMIDASTLFTYLATLQNLVFLTLKNYENPVNMEGLGALHRITQLKLYRFRNLERLPANFPPNLSYLTLSAVLVSEDPMPVLERLPQLLFLKLHYAYKGAEMVISRCGFLNLRALHLQHMYVVRNIKIEQGGMPELNQLIIHYCPELNVDNLPEHVKSAIAYGC